jgi:hypothetical protein
MKCNMAVYPPTVAKFKVSEITGVPKEELVVKEQNYQGRNASIVLIDKEGKEYKVKGEVTPAPDHPGHGMVCGGETWEMTLETEEGEQNG